MGSENQNFAEIFADQDQLFAFDFQIMSAWWYTYPSEKYESQLGWWHSQYMEK